VQISQAREQLQNTISLSAKDVFSKIADNQKRIAEIDVELSRFRLENKKKDQRNRRTN
jgi:HlyD family secretion protein